VNWYFFQSKLVTSLVPRPFPPSVLDRLQYTNTGGGNGLGTSLDWYILQGEPSTACYILKDYIYHILSRPFNTLEEIARTQD